MKTRVILYYFLVLAIVLGAFSSMAQNDYGLKIMGMASFVFTYLFISEPFIGLRKKAKKFNIEHVIELLCLSVIAFVFALRAFYIRFDGIEELFTLFAGILAVLYIYKTVKVVGSVWIENKLLASLSSLYFMSIAAYTLSMVVILFNPLLSEPLGGVGFGLLLLFLIGGGVRRELLLHGEKYTLFKFLSSFKNKSALILVIYVLFTSYMGLAKFNLIPKMYSSEYPHGYIQLVNSAETGEETPENGKYHHEKFKESLDLFVERNKK